MDWYYVIDGEHKGPVSDAEFKRLVQTGGIAPQTLVWHFGMPDWQSCAEAVPAPAPGAPSVVASPLAPARQALPGHVICAGCGGDFLPGDIILLADRPYCGPCKPLAVQRLKEGVTSTTEAEIVRKEYLKHEASVRSIGLLYYIGGVGLFVLGIASIVFVSTIGLTAGIETGPHFLVRSAIFMALGIGQFVVAAGLRRLKPWARIPTVILSCIGLLGFPIGTLVNAYLLYLVLSKKGKMVFSEEYRAVIEQTPHIKYRTSIVVWILLGLILLMIGLVLSAAFVVSPFIK